MDKIDQGSLVICDSDVFVDVFFDILSRRCLVVSVFSRVGVLSVDVLSRSRTRTYRSKVRCFEDNQQLSKQSIRFKESNQEYSTFWVAFSSFLAIFFKKGEVTLGFLLHC